jgi:hypothetical protein
MQLAAQAFSHRDELLALGPQQILRVGTGPGLQGQLDQQLRAHVTRMRDRLAQPALSGPVSFGRGGQPGSGRPQAAVLPVFRRDQAEPFQAPDGAVDHAFLHVPDHAHTAVGGQQGRERETVRRLLTDQAQHQPLGQRQPRPLPSRHRASSPQTAGRL